MTTKNDSNEIMADGVWLLERAHRDPLKGMPERPPAEWLAVLAALDTLAESAPDAVLAWYDEHPPAEGSRDAKRLAAFRAALEAVRALEEVGDVEAGDDCVIGGLRFYVVDPVFAFGVEMRENAAAWAEHLHAYSAQVEEQSIRAWAAVRVGRKSA